MVAVRKDRKLPPRMGLKVILAWGSTKMPRLTALGTALPVGKNQKTVPR